MADSYAEHPDVHGLGLARRRASPSATETKSDSATILPSATLARVAALLFFMGGTIGFVATLTVAPLDHPWQLGVLGPAAAICGAVAWLVPWERWPRLATLWPVALTLVFVTIGATAGMDPYSYGAFFTLIFTWIGITQRRGTSAIFGIPAGVAYVMPIIWGGNAANEMISVFTVIPVCILVGEALAWIAQRLKAAREQLTHALSVKDDFIAMTTHELNTPLTSILGFATTIVQRPDHFSKEQQLEFLQTIERNAQSLRHMVGNLVAMADRNGDQTLLHLSVLNVRSFIDRILDEHFAQQVERVDVDCPENLSVIADAEKLKVMLINYLSNAFKYGAPPITVSCIEREKTLEWTVSDFGQGVPEWFVPRMFEKFSQVSTGLTRTAKGLGLGLSLVSSIARAQGGDVWHEPNHPYGSRFGFRIPKRELNRSGQRNDARPVRRIRSSRSTSRPLP